MRLVVSDEVCRAFHGLRILAVVASGFDGRQQWPELEDRLTGLEASPAGGLAVGPAGDPHIAAWHAAYRAFGTNPRRQRPSAEALRRRLSRSGRLPRINPAVDACNLVSATFSVPAGAFDLRRVDGDITVRFAGGSEVFTPLGEPDTTENPHQGEVVYTDASGVLTRHWNHRDADRTKVTADSEEILFVLETVDTDGYGATLDRAAAALTGLAESRSRWVTVHEITASKPATPALLPAA